MPRQTLEQKRDEAKRIARLALGRKTLNRGRTVEATRVVDEYMIVVTFAGTGLAPFREARYTARELADMVGLR
jgi:hypothetical protein